jgi:hypothetical protein
MLSVCKVCKGGRTLRFVTAYGAEFPSEKQRTWTMRQYIISYDLYRPGHNYSDLTGAIKHLGEDWEHPLANLWIVETDHTADEIRGILGNHLIAGDKLYVREAGDDVSGMDIAPGAPGRMTAISSNVRTPGRLLARVLPDNELPSRETKLLTATTAESW